MADASELEAAVLAATTVAATHHLVGAPAQFVRAATRREFLRALTAPLPADEGVWRVTVEGATTQINVASSDAAPPAAPLHLRVAALVAADADADDLADALPPPEPLVELRTPHHAALVAGAPVSLQPLGAHARGGAVEAVLEEADGGELALRVPLRALLRLHADTHTTPLGAAPVALTRAGRAPRRVPPPVARRLGVRRRAAVGAPAAPAAAPLAAAWVSLFDTVVAPAAPEEAGADVARAIAAATERLADAPFFAALAAALALLPSCPILIVADAADGKAADGPPSVLLAAGDASGWRPQPPRAPLVERGADAPVWSRARRLAAAGALFSVGGGATTPSPELPERGAAIDVCSLLLAVGWAPPALEAADPPLADAAAIDDDDDEALAALVSPLGADALSSLCCAAQREILRAPSDGDHPIELPLAAAAAPLAVATAAGAAALVARLHSAAGLRVEPLPSAAADDDADGGVADGDGAPRAAALGELLLGVAGVALAGWPCRPSGVALLALGEVDAAGCEEHATSGGGAFGAAGGADAVDGLPLLLVPVRVDGGGGGGGGATLRATAPPFVNPAVAAALPWLYETYAALGSANNGEDDGAAAARRVRRWLGGLEIVGGAAVRCALLAVDGHAAGGGRAAGALSAALGMDRARATLERLRGAATDASPPPPPLPLQPLESEQQRAAALGLAAVAAGCGAPAAAPAPAAVLVSGAVGSGRTEVAALLALEGLLRGGRVLCLCATATGASELRRRLCALCPDLAHVSLWVGANDALPQLEARLARAREMGQPAAAANAADLGATAAAAEGGGGGGGAWRTRARRWRRGRPNWRRRPRPSRRRGGWAARRRRAAPRARSCALPSCGGCSARRARRRPTSRPRGAARRALVRPSSCQPTRRRPPPPSVPSAARRRRRRTRKAPTTRRRRCARAAASRRCCSGCRRSSSARRTRCSRRRRRRSRRRPFPST